MGRKTDKEYLLELLPQDGTAMGNSNLKKTLGWNEDKYWDVRNNLLEEGLVSLGRGKGGSIFKVLTEEKTPKIVSVYQSEKSLYQPFAEAIAKGYTKDKDIKTFIIQETANQGKKLTGGRWTRPDVVMISMNTYSFVPGKYLDVITFEIKPSTDFQITGVFETAAHSRFATKSYLCVHLPEDWDDTNPEYERIKAECGRFGVGLMYFTNPADYDTYEILVEPKRWNPDPADTDSFISVQIGDKEKKKILEWSR
ncbi:MAG: hypothetical protein JWO30_2204 [Fibrobacteres bacterium]|nr:hypothetical protein [Fibrobacterota bacterium]